MNGSKIALVLGFAGIAGLGLSAPRMLCKCARPEAAYVQPSVERAPAAAECAASPLEAEPLAVSERTSACEPAAAAEAPAHVELVAVQTQHPPAVLYPVERSAALRAVSAKSALLAQQRPDAALQQREALARKRAGARMLKDNPAAAAQLLRAESQAVDPRVGSARTAPVLASARMPIQGGARVDAVRPSEPQSARDAAATDGLTLRKASVPPEIQAKLDRAAGKAPAEKLPPK